MRCAGVQSQGEGFICIHLRRSQGYNRSSDSDGCSISPTMVAYHSTCLARFSSSVREDGGWESRVSVVCFRSISNTLLEQTKNVF